MNNYYLDDKFDFFSLFYILIPFMALDLVLRGISLWKAARKGQNIWFIALLLVNSMGILPVIYMLFNQNQSEAQKKIKKSK